MLKLNGIRKSYTTSGFTQIALDGVSVAFRDNEFAAVLGPSGSGKTTMLNIIGGLDQYDEGDLVIDGTSTKKYSDRDWDTYRNNRIGFVFQSYNLIPHQTVLSNVELALTLSGVSKTERRARAKQALEEVGLGKHIQKKPNQLSGGQMQRVAIARALINDPEILLADEPTGALDTKTSEQVMDLLTQIAEDRLVIMVTHNSELAEEYANRIIHLKDGVIVSDTRPLDAEEETPNQEKRARKASMSFWTAVSLSLSNLLTKKGRTFITALAGSIGIIGIAAIMALANGINEYIADIERETLSIYPLTISESGFDWTSLFTDFGDTMQGGRDADSDDDVYEQRIVETLFSNQSQNDLASLKAYLDENEEEIDPYVNAIQYVYDVEPQIYLTDTRNGVDRVNPDSILDAYGFGSSGMMDMSGMSMGIFYEMPGDLDMFEHQYDVVAGRWPESYDEAVLVLGTDGSITDYELYLMGLKDRGELREIMEAFIIGAENSAEDVTQDETEAEEYTYDDLMSMEFTVVNAADYYQYDDEYEVWLDKSGDETYMKSVVRNGFPLTIVGIVQADEDATASSLSQGINYTPALIEHLMEQAAESEIVQDQMNRLRVNVLSGNTFVEENRESEEGTLFSFADLITIDEEALEEAIGFDADDMEFDLSGMGDLSFDMDGFDMDFSMDGFSMDSFDLSSFDMSSMTLSFDSFDFDFSGMDFSGFDMEYEIDPDDLPPMTINLDDMSSLIGGQVNISGEALAAIMSTVLEDFFREELANGVLDPDQIMADLEVYLARPDVQAYIDGQLAGLIDSTAIEEQLNAAMQSYMQAVMQEYVQQLGGVTQAAMETAMEAYMAEIMNAVQGELVSQMEGQIGSMFSSQIESQLMSQLETQLFSGLEEQLTSEIQEQFLSGFETQTDQAVEQMMEEFSEALSGQFEDLFEIDEALFADAFEINMEEEDILSLMTAMLNPEESTYERNLGLMGYADPDAPSSINIYPMDFSAKEEIIDILDEYNEQAEADGEPERVVYYTDLVGVIMSSVTDIINTISYALIAFVAISLVVSSIMIGVITYVSVLERKKEIGILRAIGASKRNIRWVFNAETLIVGFVAGALGIAVTLLICIPANIIVANNFGIEGIAQLPAVAGVGLVFVSMLLTFVAGLFPASAAARKDPVEALRSE